MRAHCLFLLALPLALSCGDPDQFLPAGQAGGPKGVLDGTVTYSGPLPCTQGGHVVGAAVLLVFDTRALPPPEGLGTTASSLATVGGDTLFAGVRGRLTFNKDNTRWCPASDVAPVTVSATWAAAPLDGGVYQVRGFYDLDGNFDPSFSISNLPTQGDIAGGAIDNAAEVLMGKAPRYREIAIGALNKDGVRVIPDKGARIGGITVNLALPLPLQRPVFYAKAVTDLTPVMNTDPSKVTMPADFRLATFSPASPALTEGSFIRLTLGAGVQPEESEIAAKKPFNLPTNTMPPPFFLFTWQDVNGDGMLDLAGDHIPDSDKIPSLFPISIFTKLVDKSDTVRDTNPTIVMQGLTIYQSLFNTALSTPDLKDPQPDVTVALRPAALCLPADPKQNGVLVITSQTDMQNNPIVTDEAALKGALGAQFHRPIDITYGCLPQGRYAINLIYGTGQAWTVPNEAGVCSPGEPKTKDGKSCQSPGGVARPLLPSQDVVVTVGPPNDVSHCAGLPAACVPPK